MSLTPGPARPPARRERSGAALDLATYAAYSLFPLSGVLGITLMLLTGSWYWLLVVPPLAYGARQLTKRRRPADD
ncbi:hypothetical protein [Streptomyces sp. NPDC007205]|uniref:hypothetical protein n=1 Tax=Streptomyces sp. NPDC007205 TaxID=3154316 RepID=UPI0033DDB29B